MTAATPRALRHPFVELLSRYRAVLAAAWQARRELAGPARLADEAAFLPAALAIQETPVHPAPRRAAWAIMLLFALALLWSIVGQVDIVAVAPGRVVVSDGTKVVQPLEAGVIRAIHVRDGDRVLAGQVLVELDRTAAESDGRAVGEQLRAAAHEAERSRLLLGALDAGRLVATSSAPAAERARLMAEWSDVAGKLARLDAEIARRQAEVATVDEGVAKLAATLPMARQREADFKALQEQGFVSGHAGQDRTRERVELERELATQRARRHEGEAALAEARQARVAFVAETRRSLSDRLARAEQELALLRPQADKTAQRMHLARLTAPVDGTVQQLAVTTAGGVVTPAQTLMVIVPAHAEVTAEVVVENRDIGFVFAGQAAEVKVETFSFTRYGTVPATVSWVTADAVADERRGAIFPATLRLERAAIDVDGKPIRLAPGMAVTAEIKTGRRPVIDFLLSPIRRATHESLRER